MTAWVFDGIARGRTARTKAFCKNCFLLLPTLFGFRWARKRYNPFRETRWLSGSQAVWKIPVGRNKVVFRHAEEREAMLIGEIVAQSQQTATGLQLQPDSGSDTENPLDMRATAEGDCHSAQKAFDPKIFQVAGRRASIPTTGCKTS